MARAICLNKNARRLTADRKFRPMCAPCWPSMCNPSAKKTILHGHRSFVRGREHGEMSMGAILTGICPVSIPQGPVEPGPMTSTQLPYTSVGRAGPLRERLCQFGFQWIDCSDSQPFVISFMRPGVSGRPTAWWLGGGQLPASRRTTHYLASSVSAGGLLCRVFKHRRQADTGGSNLGSTSRWQVSDARRHATAYSHSLDLCRRR